MAAQKIKTGEMKKPMSETNTISIFFKEGVSTHQH
jgi:hypothetical protein